MGFQGGSAAFFFRNLAYPALERAYLWVDGWIDRDGSTMVDGWMGGWEEECQNYMYVCERASEVRTPFFRATRNSDLSTYLPTYLPT